MSLVQSDTHVLNSNTPLEQRFCFLVKLGFLLFKPQFKYERQNEKDSCSVCNPSFVLVRGKSIVINQL